MINMVTYNFKRSGLKRTRNILNNISVEDNTERIKVMISKCVNERGFSPNSI